jgi:excisionase family DNA binding protein
VSSVTVTIQPLLTVRDLSELFNVAPGTIYDWVATNRIPHFKLGGAIRFSPESIERWLEHSSRGPVAGVA